MKERKLRIAEFIDSIQDDKAQNSYLIGGSPVTPYAATNSPNCTNSSKSCIDATNDKRCTNIGNNCGDAKNIGICISKEPEQFVNIIC